MWGIHLAQSFLTLRWSWRMIWTAAKTRWVSIICVVILVFSSIKFLVISMCSSVTAVHGWLLRRSSLRLRLPFLNLLNHCVTVAKDGACSSKDVLSSLKAAEGVSRLLKQYQINSLFCSQFNSVSAINSNSQPVWVSHTEWTAEWTAEWTKLRFAPTA